MSTPELTEVLGRLHDHDSTFTRLIINGDIGVRVSDVEVGRTLGVAVGQGTELEYLYLKVTSDEIVSRDAMEAFWRGAVSNRSIKSLNISPKYLVGGQIPRLVASFIEHNYSLAVLEFNESPSGHEEWSGILTALTCRPKRIISVSFREFDWANSSIENEVMSALASMPLLISLRLRGVNFDGNVSGPLSSLLRSTTLRTLSLIYDVYHDDAVTFLAECLKSNKSLKTLVLYGGRVTAFGWEALAMSLRLYNDEINRIYAVREGVPAEIQQLLRLNDGNEWDGGSMLLRKRMDYDFLDIEREFNGQPFGEGFEVTLLPYVLWSIGTTRNERDFRSTALKQSALFHCIKNNPDLVANLAANGKPESKSIQSKNVF